MIEIKLGDKIRISCSPEEIFIISKNQHGNGFIIETAWCGGVAQMWDFSIEKDVKVHIKEEAAN
jgi:hypothetical protein